MRKIPRPAACMRVTVWDAAVSGSQMTALAPKWRLLTVRTVCAALTLTLATFCALTWMGSAKTGSRSHPARMADQVGNRRDDIRGPIRGFWVGESIGWKEWLGPGGGLPCLCAPHRP